MRTAFTSARPLPSRTIPVLSAATVLALALPIFLLAGWPVAGWALGAILWVGGQALGLLTARLAAGTGNLARAGVAAFGMMFRAIAVMVVVVAAVVSDVELGVAALLVYGLAYTIELGLSLLSYFGTPARGRTTP
jgi:hypothetical protein